LEGDYEAALATLSEALKVDPADPRLVGEAVRDFYALGQVDGARRVIEAALGADPDNVQFQRLSLLMREDLSPEERDRAIEAAR
jgi:tetratricopeptide (TPR) repeat protein